MNVLKTLAIAAAALVLSLGAAQADQHAPDPLARAGAGEARAVFAGLRGKAPQGFFPEQAAGGGVGQLVLHGGTEFPGHTGQVAVTGGDQRFQPRAQVAGQHRH